MESIKKAREFIYRLYLKGVNKNKDFTIISNNCWGGGVYEDLSLKYLTPTVGLFFYAPCYIRFLKNLKNYLEYPMEFKSTSFYQGDNDINYPIGILNGDVEIHFLHYKSEAEAATKWNERKKRINFDNLFISFSDRDLCTLHLAKEFDLLSYDNKVFFSAKQIPEVKSLIYLKEYQNQESIGDIYTNRWHYRKAFNILKWLNKKY